MEYRPFLLNILFGNYLVIELYNTFKRSFFDFYRSFLKRKEKFHFINLK